MLLLTQIYNVTNCNNSNILFPQITDTAHDENWFKAILHGQEGYIPKNYVKFTLPCWFWRHVSRGEAEKLLTGEGTQAGAFCVRRSESVQGAYSLPVKSSRDNVQHFKILPDKEGLYYIWLVTWYCDVTSRVLTSYHVLLWRHITWWRFFKMLFFVTEHLW